MITNPRTRPEATTSRLGSIPARFACWLASLADIFFLDSIWWLSGRPGGIRTPNTRIWRPLLYRWSYWPKTASADLPFLVRGVLAAPRAELAQLELVLLL